MIITCEVCVTGRFSKQCTFLIPFIYKFAFFIVILFYIRVVSRIRSFNNDMIGVLTLELEYEEEFGFRAVSSVLVITV